MTIIALLICWLKVCCFLTINKRGLIRSLQISYATNSTQIRNSVKNTLICVPTGHVPWGGWWTTPLASAKICFFSLGSTRKRRSSLRLSLTGCFTCPTDPPRVAVLHSNQLSVYKYKAYSTNAPKYGKVLLHVDLRSKRTRSGGQAVDQPVRFAPVGCFTCLADPLRVAVLHSNQLSDYR